MTELLHTGAIADALTLRDEGSRMIDLRIMPWDTVAPTIDGRELFHRGAFDGIDPTRVTIEAGAHGGPLVGRGVTLEQRDDAAYLTARIAPTPAGDDLLTLAREGVYSAASVAFYPIAGGFRRRAGVTEHSRADLRRVAILERGAFPTAAVLAVRTDTEGDMDPITETPTPDPQPTPTPAPTPDPTPEPDPQLLAIRAELGAIRVLAGRSGAFGAEDPYAQIRTFGSFGAYADAAYAAPSATDDPGGLGRLMVRVLADQITSDNPGVIPPAWVAEIAGILGFARPAVVATGGPASLGDTGMELDWPYLDPALSLDSIVAKQAAEKTQINSVKVKILKASQPIDTYAGGSDVSYQLIRRSSPSYREAYMRILAIAYARATEAAFEAQLAAVAGSSLVLTATSTADQVRAFLFAASAIVNDTTGMPATVDLVSPTEFARLGGLANLWPGAYGTQNIAGTAQASTLAVNISGIPIVRAPFLTGNTHIVLNGESARWHEDGPFPISAEDVSKLGQNIAIWGMGTGATTVPKGIVKSTLT